MKYDLNTRLKSVKAILCDTNGVLLRKNEFFFTGINTGKKHSLNREDVMMIRRTAEKSIDIGIRCDSETPFCREALYGYGVSTLFTSSMDVTKAINAFMEKYNLQVHEVGYLTPYPSRVIHFLPKLLAFAPNDASEEERKLAVHVTERSSGEGCLAELINIILLNQRADKQRRDTSDYHPFYY